MSLQGAIAPPAPHVSAAHGAQRGKKEAVPVRRGD
jgi:hypothetical protein